MMVRLRCRIKECDQLFEIDDAVFATTLTQEEYADAVRCPHCKGTLVTKATTQPCPRTWWSETRGVVTEVPRDGTDTERRVKWHEGSHHRVARQLPPDAVELRPAPKPLERYDAERLALDEYSMLWEKSRGTKGDHMKAMAHVVGVLLYGDDRAPMEG